MSKLLIKPISPVEAQSPPPPPPGPVPSTDRPQLPWFFRTDKTINEIFWISRIILFTIQFIVNLFPCHNANVFISPISGANDSSTTITTTTSAVNYLFGGFRRWDAEHYLHIAEYGYTYESSLAFYPLYPLIVRSISQTLLSIGLFKFISFRSLALVVSILLNIYFFQKSIKMLENLTKLNDKLNNPTTIRVILLLFTLNPASIFFTAPYTESLFVWLTLSTMFYCQKQQYFRGSIPMLLSICCRSNGLVNLIFFINFGQHELFQYIKSYKFDHLIKIIIQKQRLLIDLLLVGVGAIGIFATIQYYQYNLFCYEYKTDFSKEIYEYGRKNNEIIAGQGGGGGGDASKWCYDEIPMAYGYVQSHYWNVGLFKYYQLKQIPNFLLATPILSLFIYSLIEYFSKNWTHCFSLKNREPTSIYMFHATFLTIICILIVHIQVSSRFLISSSPCMAWFMAAKILNKKKSKNFDIFVNLWFGIYFVIGTAMFANFLPWT